MSIDINKLLALIAARPKIRTVEIADIMDCDPDQVQPLLQPGIDAGTVILHLVTAPNGKPANGFEMRVSPAPAKICIEAYDVEIDTAHRTKIRVQTRGIDIDKATRSVPMRKTGRAVAFVAAHGSATSEQLHAELGLNTNHSVISFLKGPVAAGRLVKDGNCWSLPPERGAAASAAPAVPVPASPALVVVADAASVPLPAPVIELPTLDVDASGFRCALWSDGAMELQRAGRTLATLTTIEQTQLSQFMRRIAA